MKELESLTTRELIAVWNVTTMGLSCIAHDDRLGAQLLLDIVYAKLVNRGVLPEYGKLLTEA